MNEAVEESTGCQNHAAGCALAAVAERDTRYPTVPIEQQILGGAFGDIEPLGFLKQLADGPAIELAVGLRARSAHCGTLAAVEDAELDPRAVDRPAHDAVERIDLAHEMAFAEPADRRIARHLADRRPLVGQQQCLGAEPSRGCRCFAARMPAANHHDVVGAETLVHSRGNVWTAP